MEKLKTFWCNNKLGVIVGLVGICFFIFQAVLSLVFYKERTLSIDTAAFSFEIVQTKEFFTPLGRCGSVLSQILPLIFIKNGCSLETFLKIYSFNFLLLYFFGFFIITFLLKNYKIGVVYILTLCLTNRYTFYFSISEFAQGLSIVVLLYAFIEYLLFKEKNKPFFFFICSLIILGLYYFHQLLIIPIVFVILFGIIHHKQYKNYLLWILFAFSVGWFGIKLLLLPENGYESNKIPSLEVFKKEISNFFDLPSFDFFLYMFRSEYMFTVLILVISLVIIFYKKEYFTFFFIISSLLGYLLLITITYYQGESPNMYDQYFIVFGFFVAFAVLVALKQNFIPKILSVLLIIVTCYSSARIFIAHELPSKRLWYIENLVKYGKKIKNKKYILHPEDFPWGYAWTGWALPVETLMLSSLNYSDNSVTFFIAEEGGVDIEPRNGQLHAAPWQKALMNTHVLDTTYFNIPEQTTYKYLNRRPRNYYFYYEQIKYDYKWMKSIKQKAKERSISIEEMIKIDAEYLLNQNN